MPFCCIDKAWVPLLTWVSNFEYFSLSRNLFLITYFCGFFNALHNFGPLFRIQYLISLDLCFHIDFLILFMIPQSWPWGQVSNLDYCHLYSLDIGPLFSSIFFLHLWAFGRFDHEYFLRAGHVSLHYVLHELRLDVGILCLMGHPRTVLGVSGRI